MRRATTGNRADGGNGEAASGHIYEFGEADPPENIELPHNSIRLANFQVLSIQLGLRLLLFVPGQGREGGVVASS